MPARPENADVLPRGARRPQPPRQQLPVLLLVLGTSEVLELVLVNVQLWLHGSTSFPVFAEHWLAAPLLLGIACAHLIRRSDRFPHTDWWLAWLLVMGPYVVLKWSGVWCDETVYRLAQERGEAIGGGAAMGHVLLGFFLFGPAQILSWLVLRCMRPRAAARDQGRGA